MKINSPVAQTILLPALVLLLVAFRVAAQIPVTSTPVTNRFDALPPTSQWSTRAQGGGATTITNAAHADTQVQTNTAALASGPLTPVSVSAPVAAAEAVWSSSGFVQTRPTGNGATWLRATLQNTTGHDSGLLTVGYDFTALSPVTEEVPGHRAYFSVSGAANSWQLINSFSSGTTGAKSAALNLTNWTNGALLYLLWLDDNGSGTPDTACQIDNFAVSFAAGPARVATPPASQSAAPGGPVALSVEATGAPPIFFQWRKDGNDIANATNSTFLINNVQPADEGGYSVIVSNSFGSDTSAVAVLTVSCAQPVIFTMHPTNQSLSSGATIQLAVAATGTAPIALQWYRDFVAIPNATNQSYTKAGALASDTGDYLVVASNCAGVTHSSTARVAVAAPPFLLLGLTNAVWKYDQSGNDLGTEWKAPGFDDSAWPSGRGVLAQESLAAVRPLTNTVLSLTNAQGASIITYYFRTRFAFTNVPSTVRLVLTNLIDDGAVFYLNGMEFHRINFSSNPWNYLTGADGGSAEGVFETVIVPGSLVVTGDNVLAVEVHQVSAGSSDVVFGLALLAEPLSPGPPVFSPQPADIGAFVGGSAGFLPGLMSLEPPRLQWFHASVPLPGETNTTLLRTNLTLEAAGLYALVASNSYGATTSRLAYLSVAGTPERLRLIEFTNMWRYNLSGSAASNWRNPGYDDGAWEQGRGVLLHTTLSGFPEATNTFLPLTNNLGSITSYFFRTTFALPAGVSKLFLVASNLLDDMAIFHLNGNEIGRFRIQSTGNTTTSSSSPSSGRAYEVFAVNVADLLPSGNVIAVQVFQFQPTSSDIVFGMNLCGYAAAAEPPVFAGSPASQTVLEGLPAVFAPQVFGSVPMHHQWLRDGGLLPGATNLTLTLPSAHPSLAGNYRLISSNAHGVVTSTVAMLTVPADVVAPVLVDATLTNGATAVLVTFSEPVSESTATNLAHYTIAPGVTWLSAQLLAPNQVLLIASGLDVQRDFTLNVSGILDRADAPNLIAPDSFLRLRPNRLPLPTGLLNVSTVFVILMQNYPWSQVKNHPDCPYINSLLPIAAWSENYHSPNDQHPSTPNTLWFEAGEAFGVEDNRGPDSWRAPTTNHFVNQLRLAGIPWCAYVEGMPADGTGTNNVSGSYFARQNPFVFFDDVTTDLDYFTNQVRTFDRFAGDLATNAIGRYNFILPSLTNSMDLLPPGVASRQQAGDNFLAALVPQILGSPAWSNNGALFIVWDEDFFTLTEPVGLMLLSPLARPGHASVAYADHSSLLRTMQEIFGVRPYLGAAAGASPLNDLFKDLSLRVAPSNGVAGVWLENVLRGRTNYVQASVDLLQWTSIHTNTATNAVFIPDPAPTTQRFYRAVEIP